MRPGGAARPPFWLEGLVRSGRGPILARVLFGGDQELGVFSLQTLSGGLVGIALAMVALLARAEAQPADPLGSYRAQREAYAETYRVEGRGDRERLTQIANEIAALVQSSSGQTRARALLELGLVRRLNGETPEALAVLGQAVQEAASNGLNDVAFEAWIGIARAH